MESEHNELDEWLAENEEKFRPPVCNKLMHQDSQLKVMFVGGPNQRKDYHLEEGEEFFYQLKGNMCLKVIEHNKMKDIHIKEGECFLLRGRTLHSPNREAKSLGLVFERERRPDEKDCLRYFVDGTTETLFERWFYCDDLGTRLVPLVKEFFASEQYRTGIPKSDDIREDPPYLADQTITCMKPFNLNDWINKNRGNIDADNGLLLIDDPNHQSEVRILGKGVHSSHNDDADVFIFQLEGKSSLDVDGEVFGMKERSCHLVKKTKRFTLKSEDGAVTLAVMMDAKYESVKI